MIKTTFFYTLERAIAFVVARDPASRERLQFLEGRVILLECIDIDLKLFWLFERGQIRLFSQWDDPIDASMRGTMSVLFQLAANGAKVSQELNVSGELRTIEAFKNIFAHLEIDWEDYFSQYLGDVPAHALNKAINHAKHFLKKAGKSFFDNFKEYAQEEGRLVISKQRFSDFSHEVRETHRATERLQARIKKLVEDKV